jgi:hypothetical protein
MRKGRRISVAERKRELSKGGAWLLAGLALLTVASLALFPFTERNAGFFVRAIHQYDTLDLQRWAYTYDDNARSRYGMYLALDIAAPGSTVIVADGDFGGDPTFDQRLYSFGGVTQVIHIEGSGSDLLGDVEPASFAMASGAATSHGPAWMFCARPRRGDTVVEGNYVAHALAGDPVARTDARTFVLVSVPMIDRDGRTSEGLALVEAGLLPDGALAGADA